MADNRENSFDVIVVGLGAMGSAACLHLARRGVRVLGLEQFGVPHALGSSHGESRMIRLCYFEHPDYVPLLHRAYELWHELEAESGQKLLHMTGGIYMGEPESAFISGTLRAAREYGLPHEQLGHCELQRRYPQFVLPGSHVGVYEPNAGFLRPELAVATHARLALRHGARLHGHEPVISWHEHHSGDGVTVKTQRAEYSARRIIFCGGAWSERLLGEIGVKLVVTRQVLGWVWPKEPALFEPGRMPVWAIDHPDGTEHYGFPMHEARPGFKIAHHFKGTPTTAEAVNRMATREDEADFRWVLERFIPQASGELLSMAVCMYTNSPDSHFIVDAHPRHPSVVLACGFSGHGFKFSSVMGEALADLAETGSTRHPVGFLGLSRFSRPNG